MAGMEVVCLRKSLIVAVFLAGLALVEAAAAEIDKTRYITLDEVRPDTDAYCLTVFRGTQVEKFPFRVLSVVRGWNAGRDAILVLGTDERFKHTGIAAGCSGSPLFIDGRMAGAIAATWHGSKDPLAIVTPIEYMLEIGTGAAKRPNTRPEPTLDLSGPMNLVEANTRYLQLVSEIGRSRDAVAGTIIPAPLVASMTPEVCRMFAEPFGAMGLTIIPLAETGAAGATTEEAGAIERGGVLAVPLLSGDMRMAATGTVTEVIGDRVYAFGHNFTGFGPVDMPIASGRVHTVVPGLMQAFKFSTPGPIVGALQFDEDSGIVGQIGGKPTLADLNITVRRYNDPHVRTYDCRMAVTKFHSPLIVQSATAGAVLMYGDLPNEHSIRYDARIEFEGFDTIELANVSTGQMAAEVASELGGVLAEVMLNRFAPARVRSVRLNVDVADTDLQAGILSVDVSHSVVKPGRTVFVDVVLQSYMSDRQALRFEVRIPEDLPPGSYEILVAGAAEYEKYVRRVAPHRFTAWDMPTLAQALRTIVSLRRDRLYLVMNLPAAGVAIQQSEMPHLPESRTLLMQDPRRTTPIAPLQQWLLKELPAGRVVVGARTLKITVEPL